MRSVVTGFLCLFASSPFLSSAQRAADSLEITSRLSDKYVNSIGERSESINKKIDQQTGKYLDGLKKQEQSLQKQLSRVDTGAAARIFKGSEQQYDKLQNDLKNNSENVLKSCGRYVPGIDTAITSLKFLQQGALANPKLAGQFAQIKSSLGKVKELEDQFKKADNVQDFIRQRQEYLTQELSGYNLGNGLAGYNKQAYYYSQQVTELKQAWGDPSRMEQKALEVLNKLPSFRDFMKKNSLIAGLFNIPDDYATSAIAGLQTRNEVQQLIQQRMIMIPGGQQQAQQNIGDAQSMLTGLRNRLQQTGSSAELPDAKINNQHTKSLLKRLVYGMDAQNNPSTYFVPLSTAFALTIGYKLNDRSTAGVGVSYNVSWGSDIRHIKISNNGIGLRSFLDVKIKGSIYASGGAEYNYNHVFTSLNQLQSKTLWQPSGLIGLSKVISLKGNLVKQTKVQLFWDPVSYTQSPRTQPFKFRVGYNF